MERYDIIVIGSGISGLSLAYFCAREGLNPLVIEKDERIGGTFHTHHFPGDSSAFWLELGAHTCYNSYGILITMMEGLNLLSSIIRREKVSYKMLVDGRVVSLLTQVSLPELFISLPHLLKAKKSGQTVESYYSSIVGKRNFEKAIGPMFNAVICQKANDFPADVLFKKRRRRKDVLKSFTLLQGMQSITDTLAAQPRISIIKGKEVASITVDGDLFLVAARDGSSFTGRGIAVATEASTAAHLLKSPFPELSQQIAKIPVSTVETVGVVLKKGAVSLKPIAGLIAVNEPFYSVVSRDMVGHDAYRGFTFHFRGGLLDHNAKLRRIGEVLGTDLPKIEETASRTSFVPSLGVEHQRIVHTIDSLIEGRNIFMTGNYFAGLAIEDCVARSRAEAERIKKRLM